MPAIITLHHYALRVSLIADLLEGREPLVTKVSPLILNEVACPVRTGDDAIFATDAFFLVDEDDAIGTLLRRFRRADFLAGGLIALHRKSQVLRAGAPQS